MPIRIASLLLFALVVVLAIAYAIPSVRAPRSPQTRRVIYAFLVAASIFLLVWNVSHFMHF
jgi:hypothetical protein